MFLYKRVLVVNSGEVVVMEVEGEAVVVVVARVYMMCESDGDLLRCIHTKIYPSYIRGIYSRG